MLETAQWHVNTLLFDVNRLQQNKMSVHSGLRFAILKPKNASSSNGIVRIEYKLFSKDTQPFFETNFLVRYETDLNNLRQTEKNVFIKYAYGLFCRFVENFAKTSNIPMFPLPTFEDIEKGSV